MATNKTLDDIYEILVQIKDFISTPIITVANDGITLGGTDAGRPHGVAGQSISNGLSNNVHLS